LSAKALTVDSGVLVQLVRDRLDRLRQGGHVEMKQLRLLLQHADVGHHLLVFAVRRRNRFRRAAEQQHREDPDHHQPGCLS
jgi:hypothetical protein